MSNDTMRAALEALLAIHTEPAGFVGKYGKELTKFLDLQQAKIDAAVAQARAALAAPAPQPEPLTDKRLDELRQENGGRLNFVTLREFREVARAVEAELQSRYLSVGDEAVTDRDAKDAARYRWLRDNPWPPVLEADIKLHRNARWDAEIDTAMAVTPEGKEP